MDNEHGPPPPPGAAGVARQWDSQTRPSGTYRDGAPSVDGTSGGWPTTATVLAVLSLVAAVGAGVTAYINYGSAADWELAATDARTERDDATDRIDELEAEIDDLEGQLAQVASDKASIADEREELRAAFERIAEVAVVYDDVAEAFRSCVAEQDAFRSMAFNFEQYWRTGQSHLVEQQARTTGAACGTAEGYLAELRDYVYALASQR